MTWRRLAAISCGIAAIGWMWSCSAEEAGGVGGLGPEGGFGGTVQTTTSGTTSIAAGGQGGFGGVGIAGACEADADCGHGLSCLLDTTDDAFFGGGPAGGFCTRSCKGARDCLEPGAVCLQDDPTLPGRCTLSCTVGPPIEDIEGLFSMLDAAKCHGREDLRCGKVKAGIGVCLPTCGKDAQCSGDRACDPRLAVCVAQPNKGAPAGSACDPTAPDADCAGTCVGFDNGAGMCSSPCVLGGAKLDSQDCGGIDHGLCAFHLGSYGAGDMGHCTPSCEAQTDCQNPAFFCFDVVGLSEIVHRGYCFAAASCPNGQDDCVAQGAVDTTCTTTPDGAFCLDPSYPVGVGGSGGGGGMGQGGMGGASAADAGAGDASSGGASAGGSGGAGP